MLHSEAARYVTCNNVRYVTCNNGREVCEGITCNNMRALKSVLPAPGV